MAEVGGGDEDEDEDEEGVEVEVGGADSVRVGLRFLGVVIPVCSPLTPSEFEWMVRS